MVKQLHYDGTAIELADDTSIDALTRSVDAAAEGSGWLPIVDKNGTTHRLRVSGGVAVRLSNSKPPAPTPSPVSARTSRPHAIAGF